MKKYIHISKNNIVREIINEFDDNFPGVGIEKRYNVDLLNKCRIIEDTENIPVIGYIYDEENNTYNQPIAIIPNPNIAIETARQEIYMQLEELDNTITRQVEQLYSDLDMIPEFTLMADAITQKIALRAQLLELGGE